MIHVLIVFASRMLLPLIAEWSSSFSGSAYRERFEMRVVCYLDIDFPDYFLAGITFSPIFLTFGFQCIVILGVTRDAAEITLRSPSLSLRPFDNANFVRTVFR